MGLEDKPNNKLTLVLEMWDRLQLFFAHFRHASISMQDSIFKLITESDRLTMYFANLAPVYHEMFVQYLLGGGDFSDIELDSDPDFFLNDDDDDDSIISW